VSSAASCASARSGGGAGEQAAQPGPGASLAESMQAVDKENAPAGNALAGGAVKKEDGAVPSGVTIHAPGSSPAVLATATEAASQVSREERQMARAGWERG